MTTPSARAEAKSSPTRRDEVVAAILDSAVELFARRGPAASSIRDIATHAGVNHGLVHRYFGSKGQLVSAVLDHLGAEVAALIGADAPIDAVERAADRHAQVVARVVLDGFEPAKLQTAFPGTARLLEHARTQTSDSVNASLAVAHAIALRFGWQLFGPYLRAAAGIDISEDEVRQDVRDEITRILRRADSR